MYKRIGFITICLLVVALTACKAQSNTEDSMPFIDNEIIDTTESNVELSDTTDVIVNGPYGSIQLSVPKTWDFEIREVDDEKLIGSSYGIHLKPVAESKGGIEVGFHDSFGVCGTGLETKCVTLTNGDVNIGYYDGSDNWSYLKWTSDNDELKNIVVLSNADWGAAYLDELLGILDSLIFDKENQTGGIGVYEVSSELGIDDGYLLVSAKKVSRTGATLVFTYSNYRKDNSDVQDELYFGSYLPISKRVGENWILVEYQMDDTPAFEDIAYIIQENEETIYEYNWEWLYGSLEPGEYQITIPINSEAFLYAYFILR